MKEYGVAESWIKCYKISPWGGFSKTLSLRQNGEILILLRYGELGSYDPESLRISPLEIHGIPDTFFMDTYVDSLFLWRGMNRLLGDQRKVPAMQFPVEK
uniref:Uncharacterized protein n=1 Tax=Rhizophora mucronata TaxID=61149 RepID=A0A2P2MXH2_RHIMU